MTKKSFEISDRKADYRSSEWCDHFPYGYVRCDNFRSCARCELADRIRSESNVTAPLFDYRDALPQTPTGCMDWIKKPVILKPQAMERLGIPSYLVNQIMITELSPGIFHKNACSDIDGYLFADPSKKLTVSRADCYGVPNARAVERFDKIYFLKLSRFMEGR